MFASIVAEQGLTPAQQAMVNDLENHRRAELEELNVDHTLATMTERPYLFFVATLTGGTDRSGVRDFYTNMLNQLPKDMAWIPISSTVGTNRIVIESVLTFTHSIKMDWILPDVLPTRAKVKIPLVIIFTFSDGKLESERIYWDQASTLMQLGLLKSDGLPISGRESADKLLELTKPGERFGD